MRDIPGGIPKDGDNGIWQAKPDRIPLDNQRDNDLVSSGWRVLHFNGKQIIDQMGANCLGKIQQTIIRLGGLSEN